MKDISVIIKQPTMTKENTVSDATQAMLDHNDGVTNQIDATIFRQVSFKRKHNSDWKQIAGKDDGEVYYVSYSYGVPMDVIRQIIIEYRSSRKRVYKILREMGYIIDTKNRRK